MLTRLRTDLAMFVKVRMALALGGAGARESDACCELCFEELPVADLVGARQDASGRGADGGAIVIEPDAGDQPLHVLLGETGIGTGGAGLHASKTGIDASAERIGVARLLRMRAEHGSNSNGGHGYLPCERACRITSAAALCSCQKKVPDRVELHKSSHGLAAF
jgi:hypothetical protein